MKWLFIVFCLLLIVAGIKMYPLVYQEKACYDDAEGQLKDIQFSIVSRGWSKENVCSERSLKLLDLDDCLRGATTSSRIARYLNGVIDQAVYIVRPLTKSLAVLKNEHNVECSDYVRFQVE